MARAGSRPEAVSVGTTDTPRRRRRRTTSCAVREEVCDLIREQEVTSNQKGDTLVNGALTVVALTGCTGCTGCTDTGWALADGAPVDPTVSATSTARSRTARPRRRSRHMRPYRHRRRRTERRTAPRDRVGPLRAHDLPLKSTSGASPAGPVTE